MLIHQSQDLNACTQKVERLSACIEIANVINSELSIGRLLTHVMETAKKAFSADSASLLLQDEKTGDLVFQVALGEVGDEIREIYRLKKGQGIAGYVAETRQPLNLKDVYQHPNFSPDYDRKTGYRTRTMICVPLKIRGRILGVIQVINKLKPPYFFSDEELEMLETIGSSAAVAIDTAQMHQVIIQRETLERDLKLAREVQQSFLPAAPPHIEGYRFAVLNQPALDIGGDFYHFFHLPGNRLGIVLGDVSGKGIAASLYMARLISDLQYNSLLFDDPARLLGQINSLLCQRSNRGMFVTLVYMVLDIPGKKIFFSNAGHPSPVYSDRGSALFLGKEAAKGPPLGILPHTYFTRESLELEPGSVLTLFTDGITEARNGQGNLFGMDRLINEILKVPDSPDLLIQNIPAAVDRYTLGEARKDDLTLLSMGVD
ncbi:PP2C family protein-serine/threonine phosphatase [Desulfospira joergensenii]|uniref:PP2C family protein-serine/threonine phosphatase n=1 Tax=Desulfospira joergensenii TaxID=53329 RepID=UPI0003B3FC28|nr:GAF domain-containing SpoIIE family protein phosphatase [Desulfospira joergensenii]